MLYDAYVVKMKKLVALRNWILKYKFILLAITIVILAGTISFLASIGSIKIVNDCKEEIVYGEKIKFQASAFLKEVSYEYRGDGMRQWTSELPLYPGEYEVRGVAKGFFGNSKYTDSQEFKILPKEITLNVNNQSVQYGDNISLSGGLVSGDKAYIEDLTGNITSLQSINIREDQKVTIYNSLNQDVTKCYNYKVTPKTVSVTKRNVTIEVESISKKYDGSPLTSDEYKITNGSIYKNDSFSISFDDSITLVNTVYNTPICQIKNKNGIDVTHLYNIVYNPKGSLTVTKADLKIETGSSSFEYDAQSHQDLSYELKNTLPAGHTIEVTSGTTVSNVGTYDNTLQVVIRNQSNVDVTACFNIEFTKGKIEITKRKISIETGSTTFTYNALVQNYLEYTITSTNKLCSGDTITPNSKTSAINVGRYDNDLSFVIKNTRGDDISNNYDITVTKGTITINKLPITIQTGSTELIYNGTNQSCQEYTITSTNKIPSVDTAGVDTFTEIMNVGQIENQLTIKISNNKFENVTSNYEITYVYGQIKILKRPVTINTASSSHVFDDTDYKDETYTVSSTYNIVESHTTEVIGAPTIKYVGTIQNSFSIIIKDNSGENVSSNYELTYNYGTLTVTKRPITINTNSYEHTYDATYFKDTERSMITKTDIDHDITYKSNVFNEIKNVGEIDNICEVLDIKDSTGYSVLNNYEITYNFGKLIVIQRPITVTTGSTSKEYDGTPLVFESANVENLVSGHNIYYSDWVSITNVGFIDNEFGSFQVYENSEDVTANYAMTIVPGTLTVTPRFVTIESTSYSKEYDGTNIYQRNYNIVSGSVAPYQNLTITSSTEFCDVGVRVNEIYATVVTDAYGEYTTSNYVITYENNGQLEITKRRLEITTASNSWIYDGTAHYDTDYVVDNGSLVSGEELVATTYPFIKNVGQIQNNVGYNIIKANGMDSTANYDLYVDYGYISVVPRDITIKPVDAEKVYDDTPLVPTNFEVTSFLTIPADHITTVYYAGSITNVGIEISSITEVIIYQGNVDVTSNFNITKETGFLVVTPRPIETTPKTITYIYNGQKQTNEKASFDGPVNIVDGHTYSIYHEIVSLIDVGKVEFEYYIDHIYNDQGIEVTSNYEITSNKGIFEVIPRDIYVYTRDYSKEYDGKYITSLDIELFRTLDTVDGQQVLFKDNYTKVKNVGAYENYLEVDKIVDTKNGDRDVTHNYNISYKYGTITITPREIKFKTESDEKVYDGTPLSNSTYTIIEGSLAKGERLEVVGSTEVTEFTKGTPNELFLNIYNELDEETTSNYLITYEHGYLTILKRDINIKTGSLSEVYTSREYSNDEYSLGENQLVSTDTIEIENLPTFVTVGKYVNEITFRFYNKDNKNVSSSYNPIFDYGTIDITPRHITIETMSDSKLYDGKEFYCTDYVITSDYPEPDNFGVGPNDHVEVVEYIKVIHVGEYQNILKLQFFDSLNNDVTYCYTYDYVYGTLTIINSSLDDVADAVIYFNDISKRIDYSSSSQTWTENDITFTSSGSNQSSSIYPIRISSTHTVTVQYPSGISKAIINTPYGYGLGDYASIEGAEITTYNYYTEIIFTEPVTEFTISGTYFRAYSIEIYEPEQTEIEIPSEPEDPSIGDEDGTEIIKKPQTGTGSTGEGEEKLIFKFTTDNSGYMYFRQESYGDYNESGFENAVKFDFSSYKLNPLYLVSKALEDYGYETSEIEINIVAEKLYFVLPYYSTTIRDGLTDSISDIVKTSTHILEYINMSSIDYTIPTSPEYIVLEAVYREFVHDNYLSIPISTKGTLDNIIAEYGLDKNSSTIVSDVQNFLQNFGQYNLKFAEYPQGCDMVAHFFEVAKEGICQHYAAAGTMLFRALGIPARYTTGYMVQSKYGEETLVYGNSGHAWVEIYIDGLGWVPVEVTSGNISSDGEDNEHEEIEISLKPVDRIKEYDGITLYPYTVDDIGKFGIYQIIEGTDELNKQLLENLISKGYKYYVEISGQQKEIGVSDSVIEKIQILDPDGKDVTEYFKFTLLPGKLEVVENLITVYGYNYTKYYDGTPLNALNEFVYKYEGLEEGYQLYFDLSGSITNVGSVDYELINITLLDKDGNDITKNYTFKVIGSLVVIPRKITISSGSAMKDYDEEPLTNSNYYISIGSLVDGHTLSATTVGTITYPGTVDNLFNKLLTRITNSSNQDVTLNYNISYSYGILEIVD